MSSGQIMMVRIFFDLIFRSKNTLRLTGRLQPLIKFLKIRNTSGCWSYVRQRPGSQRLDVGDQI